ncbi:MAG: gamma-glutamylcyclotransferase family protein [Verrucomicrobiota bacterium]
MNQPPLFVYGSLLSDDVVELVIGRVAQSEVAVLSDFACYYVAGVTFPGIIHQAGAKTEGRLLLELQEHEIQALDQYEDTFYQRIDVQVRTRSRVEEAMAYVVPEVHHEVMSDQHWTWKEFQRLHLTDYVARMRG